MLSEERKKRPWLCQDKRTVKIWSPAKSHGGIKWLPVYYLCLATWKWDKSICLVFKKTHRWPVHK